MSIYTTVPLDDTLEASNLSTKFTCCFDNISELRNSCPRGKYVNSDTVKDIGQFLNGQVYLQFYPCGIDVDDEDEDPNFLSLFLVLKRFSANDVLFVCSKITVIDALVDDEENGFDIWFLSERISSERIPMIHGDKIGEKLAIEVDMKFFTQRTYSRWIKVHPTLENGIDTELLRKHAIEFGNQLFEDDDLGMIEVDGEQNKLFKVSKEVVCNIGNVFNTRLTNKEWAKEQDGDVGKVYTMVGYDSDLVHKFLQSMHTGILRWNSWEDQLDLLEISNEYEVEWIKEKVSNLIKDSLNVENVIQSFIRSDLSDAKELRKKCLALCDTNYNQLKDTDEWKELITNYHDLVIEVMAERLARMSD